MEHNTQRRHYPSFTTNADTFILDQGLARLMKLFACSENILSMNIWKRQRVLLQSVIFKQEISLFSNHTMGTVVRQMRKTVDRYRDQDRDN